MTALWPLMKGMWRVFTGFGKEECNIKLPDISAPMPRKDPIPGMSGKQGIPSAQTLQKSNKNSALNSKGTLPSKDEKLIEKEAGARKSLKRMHDGVEKHDIPRKPKPPKSPEDVARAEKRMPAVVERRVYHIGYRTGYLHEGPTEKLRAMKKALGDALPTQPSAGKRKGKRVGPLTRAGPVDVKVVFNAGFAAGWRQRRNEKAKSSPKKAETMSS